MGQMSITKIIRLSREHDKLHKRYQKGHCPACYGGTLDKMDLKSAKKYLLSTPLKTSQTRSENKESKV